MAEAALTTCFLYISHFLARHHVTNWAYVQNIEELFPMSPFTHHSLFQKQLVKSNVIHCLTLRTSLISSWNRSSEHKNVKHLIENIARLRVTCWLSYLMSVWFTRSSSSWQGLYRDAGRRSLPTGYRLPGDTPHFKHAKDTRYMSSYVSGFLLSKMGSEVGEGTDIHE